jgi:ATP-dependent Clp protease ATP-binding subunit ClpC
MEFPMFERYTEKARRVIFFGRYEASQFGSPYIETEHLLLGILREDHRLVHRCLPARATEAIRRKVEDLATKRPQLSTAVDLPLSEGAKQVLKKAAVEADELAHNHISTEHLLLALFSDESATAAVILKELGVNAADLRTKIAKIEPDPPGPAAFSASTSEPDDDSILIHGARRDASHIHSVVSEYRRHPWHWRQEVWLPRDIVQHLEAKQISFDLSLANDGKNFKIVKGGWASDNCVICG